jgi:hypothetical protein
LLQMTRRFLDVFGENNVSLEDSLCIRESLCIHYIFQISFVDLSSVVYIYLLMFAYCRLFAIPEILIKKLLKIYAKLQLCSPLMSLKNVLLTLHVRVELY